MGGGRSVAENESAMSLYGVTVEYGLHTLLWLLSEQPKRARSRDLADVQGIPTATLAEILPKLKRPELSRLATASWAATSLPS